ncbi:hypothetical protein NUW58_g439 [Xylaria curta]|uniref:Uncharacterized protein n=1 Tax=Xylaria curta TaxID=42375 RepID=A0ACC1PR90_9PEZI|nr:hypothetical protein NUW58_g439 [Xylaria curta]
MRSSARLSSRAIGKLDTATQSSQQPLEDQEDFEDSDDTGDPHNPEDSVDIASLDRSSHNTLRLDLQPITNGHQAFKDLLSKRQSEIISMANSGGFQLRVATMCSGTEAPVFALKLIKEISQLLTDGRTFLQYDHKFSVEIEPFKQAYISRNAPGSIVFRDVVDFADPQATDAPTILGDHCKIPQHIDLLVAGTSCVDFSTLNSGKRNSMQLASTGSSLVKEWKNSKGDRENKKPEHSLRPGFYDEFREWLNSITPAEIQTAAKVIGESSYTFLSTVCYVNRHRPKMVVFENVTGAPWGIMSGLFLRAAGYEAIHTLVDTKEYYIPQTRTRGYVVAIDCHVFGNSARQILDEWKILMNSLKRAPSAPVRDWLLSPHDPLTVRARQDESEKAVSHGLNTGRDSQWDRSRMRHTRVRRLFNLGDGRPLTAWGLGGIERPYDRIDKLVIKGQNNRSQDFIDIISLRCLRAGANLATNLAKVSANHAGPVHYDIKFKCQTFDLSQNIDRGQISRNFGITGCLTPRGLNLITCECRFITGYEALLLQGLPLRDLHLSRESQDELRDLAGNAMSVTVIGAALFSLLFAIHQHAKNVEPRPLNAITTEEQVAAPYQPLYRPSFMEATPEETWSIAPEPLCNAQGIIDLSERCRRYCYCNGGAKYSTEELVRCQVCGIIRCTSCAGNPKHHFGPPMSVQNPITNDTAPREMMTHFPTALTNIIGKAIDHIPFRPDFQDPAVQSPILRSLQSAVFYYTRVLISETVTVCYCAKDDDCSFDLHAVISDKWVTWYLSLDPWSRCGQLLSERLRMSAAQILRPFGRARIHQQASEFLPRQDAWHFWMFNEISFDVDIRKPHPNSVEIHGIPFADLPVATHADLRSIEGTYYHHPECDTAEDSLHTHTQDPKRYLFKDPTRTGPPQEDCYIVSDECRFLEKHEFRDFCIKFMPDWTPQVTGTRAIASIKGYWLAAVANPTQSQAIHQNNLISYMKKVGSRSIPHYSELHLNDTNHNVRTLASVRLDANALTDTYMFLSKYGRVGPENWAVVSSSDYSALFDLLAPVNVNLENIECEIQLTGTKSCKTCSPTLPDVHWMEKIVDGAKKSGIREPYRLSSEMRMYHERLRKCDEPLQVAVNIKDAKDRKGWKELTASYEVNVDLLMHRALDHLPLPKDDPEKRLHVRTSVAIDKGSWNIPNLKFEPFRKSLLRLSRESSQETINLSNLFIDGHVLTEQQKVSLYWMMNRELAPLPFSEREIEECRFDALNLRILAVAERDIPRRGGILADDVGYGKTIIVLGLLVAQQYFDQNQSLQERSDNEKDTLALAASLVIVPKHLVDQWCKEIRKFSGWTGAEVSVVKSSRDLQGILKMKEYDSRNSLPPPKRARSVKGSTMVLEDLKAAKIILVSTAVFDDNYYTWLGKYAGSLAHPHAIPRTSSTKDTANPNTLGAFDNWYEDATEHARKHLCGFNLDVFNLGQLETIERRQEAVQDSWRRAVADHYENSTRLGFQTSRKDRTGKTVKGKKEDATVQKEYSDIGRANRLTKEDLQGNPLHPLEAFSFSRIILDEFSYENYSVALFFKKAKARAKWILSATPPTSNVKAVCDIGKLLNIHVARPVKLRPGLPRITEGPIVLRQSPTEKQLSYGKMYTDKSVYERVEQAHKFLRHFASANPFDEEGLGKIEVSEHAYCSYMTRRQLAKYLDIQQDLRNSDLEVSNLLKRHKIDSAIMTEFPLEEGRLRAGLALAYAASVDCTDDDDDDGDGDIAGLLLSRRQNLETAQKELKYIADVAIWLVIRRFQEEVEKKNDSATLCVDDLAYDFGTILEGQSDVCGGVEALKAITDALFDKGRFARCSKWLASVDPATRNSENFFQSLFTLLGEQTTTSVWATYFRLSADRVDGLTRSEVYDFVRELSGRDPGLLPEGPARQRLRELVADKQILADPQSDQTQNHRQNASKRKARDVLGSNKSEAKYPRFNVRKRIRGGNYSETESELTDIMLKWTDAKNEVIDRARQVTTALNLFCEDAARECSACGQSCDDLRFLPECGHFICPSHLGLKSCGMIKSEKYPNGSGCPAFIHQRSIPASQISLCTMETMPQPVYLGDGKGPPRVHCKSQNIVHTINEIVSCGERVLVFYQFEKQKREIRDLLNYYDDLHDIQSGARAKPSDDNRIRILKLNSEEAAGSNFQDANHVIFISTPVFGKQEDFEKYVKQAKGRAIRYGQLKQVKIYYFVTANSFEVDLLQLRKKSELRLVKEGVAKFIPMNKGAHRGPDSGGDVDMGNAPDESS